MGYKLHRKFQHLSQIVGKIGCLGVLVSILPACGSGSAGVNSDTTSDAVGHNTAAPHSSTQSSIQSTTPPPTRSGNGESLKPQTAPVANAHAVQEPAPTTPVLSPVVPPVLTPVTAPVPVTAPSVKASDVALGTAQNVTSNNAQVTITVSSAQTSGWLLSVNWSTDQSNWTTSSTVPLQFGSFTRLIEQLPANSLIYWEALALNPSDGTFIATRGTPFRTNPVAAPPAPGWPSVLRLLPLGDSMTEGGDAYDLPFRSYRQTLYTLLRPAVTALDFVGPQSASLVPNVDADHAGYSGALIGSPNEGTHNIFERLPAIFAAAGDPNIIVMFLGYNSILAEPSLAGQKYRNIVEYVRAQRPNALIVVATMSPGRDGNEAVSSAAWPGYRDLNNMARSLGTNPIDPQIVLADVAADVTFESSDYTDGIHLAQSGADKVARVIYQAISDYYERTR